MYYEDSLKIPPLVIASPKKTSFRTSLSLEQRATISVAIALSIFGFSVLVPTGVTAFWPFTATRAAEGDAPVMHDPKLALLAAAINEDPNPSKGGQDLPLSNESALIDTSGPIGTFPTKAEVKATNGGTITTYVVKEGDSLSEIASDYGVTMNTILWANDIKDAKLVRPGTSLIILPVSGVRHTVLKGQTLSSLAKKYGADSDDIAAFNGIDNDASLKQGQVIIIPGGELQSPITSKTTTKTTKNSTSVTSKTTIKTGGSLSQIQANPFKGGSGVEAAGYFTAPVPGGLLTQSIHGWNGVDIGAPSGTPVYAAAAGTVVISKIGGWNGGYGDYVVIDHPNGSQTLYAHLSQDSVSVGQSVAKGEKIGTVGNSGQATGFHLHFEVRGAKNPYAGCASMTRCSPK